MLAPRWSHEPLSGAGAAFHGGRWNAPGRPALYMSRAFEVAVAEYEQELGIRPGTLCAYDVHASAIADLTDSATLADLSLPAGFLLAPWKTIFLIEKKRPASWDLAERLLEAGIAGALVPSARARGVNLVLWRWNEDDTCRISALDPLGDLPRDPSSWSAEPTPRAPAASGRARRAGRRRGG